MPDYCAEHIKLATDLATIKETLQNIAARVCNHIEEGERQGGYRDRVVVMELAHKNLEKELAAIRSGRWVVAVVSGVIGGLVGGGAPQAVIAIAKTFGLI